MIGRQECFSVRTVLVLALLTALGIAVGCGGSNSSTTTTSSSGSSGSSSSSSSTSNTLTLSVNGGAEAAGGSIYQNAAFASATICAPGSTTNCVTIDNLLVDTGSTGLRVFDSEVSSLDLPAVNASNGSAAYDCASFVDNDYLWGTVSHADVTLGGEKASNLPIQVISSSNSGAPSSCSNGGESTDSVSSLGANGILGVGLEPTDCYVEGIDYCSSTTNLVSGAYYTCSTSGTGASCAPAAIAQANQVTNPVVLFPTDNNGVILELPSATMNEASITGSLIFGIGTESNNALPSSASVFTLSCDDFFTTVFGGQTYGVTNPTTCAGPGSFIDSGSNGFYFPNATNIPTCPSSSPLGNLSSYYCPASTESLSATMEGANGMSHPVSFSVANAEDIFSSATTDADAVVPQVAGTNPSGYGFDWGLPFFYGVNVYNAIDGQSVPSGAPAAPWWAY
jgi:hypothetical protein